MLSTWNWLLVSRPASSKVFDTSKCYKFHTHQKWPDGGLFTCMILVDGPFCKHLKSRFKSLRGNKCGLAWCLLSRSSHSNPGCVQQTLGKLFYFSESVSWKSEEFVPAVQTEVKGYAKHQYNTGCLPGLLVILHDFGDRTYFCVKMNANILQ